MNIFDGLDAIPADGGTNYMGGSPNFNEAGPTVTPPAVNQSNFDSSAYLKANPDVAAAINSGAYKGTAWDHYVRSGQSEGRNAPILGAQAAPAPAAAPAAAPADASTGSFADQLRANLTTAYPSKAKDPAWLSHMVDYYTNDVLPRASGDTKYVLDRALGNGNGGADTAEAGPYAGHDFGPDTGSSSNQTLGNLGNLPVTPPGNFTPPANTSASPFVYAQGVPTPEKLQQVTPLTAEQLQNDPAYQFRLSQGIGALQNSAAAKGSVRDPNVWKGLIDYGQNAASQEADKIASRNLAFNSANNSAISGNNAASLGAQGQGFGQALGGYQANLGALGQNYNQAANTWGLNNNAALGWGNLALGNKQANNSFTLGNNQFGLQQQGQYWNQAFNNNAQQWNQYYQLAQLGLPPQ